MIELIILLVVVGFLLWVVEAFVPMDAKIKMLLQVVVVLILVFYVLQFFGILGNVGHPLLDVRRR